MTLEMFNDLQVLSRGRYLQLVIKVTLLDDAIIRSNEPEELLTFNYENLGERYIIPWRKFKGKLRRMVLEQQRGYNISPDCSLKDNLCMKCPTCLLFGGTGETSSAKADYNLLSRVLGETLISSNPAQDPQPYTANAVDEETLTTGQALMNILKVPVGTEFIGVVVLRDPTPETASILVDNISRLSRLGASTREWGKCKVNVIDYDLSDREALNVYDLVKNGIEKQNMQPDISELKLSPIDEALYKKVEQQVQDLIKRVSKKAKQQRE